MNLTDTLDLGTAQALIRDGLYEPAQRILDALNQRQPSMAYRSALDFIRRKTQRADATASATSPDITGRQRILFVTAGFKGPTPGGGIATCFHSMVHTLASTTQHEVSVVYLAHPYYASGTHDSWKAHFQDTLGVAFFAIPVERKNYGSLEMQRSAAVADHLIRHDGSYDCVVFHDFMGLGYYTLLAKRLTRHLSSTRVVISAHGNHLLSYRYGARKFETWNEKVTVFMERESLRMADDVTTPSAYYRDWMAEHLGRTDARVLPNILLESTDGTGTLNTRFKHPERRLVVFYGRFERLKGLDVLLEALKLLNAPEQALNVLFAGNTTKINGRDAKEYIEQALEGSAHELAFSLNCAADHVYNLVRQTDGVCVFPTLGETSSCVVVESAIRGVRFIASDIPPIRELLTDSAQREYLVPTGSARALADRLFAPLASPTADALTCPPAQAKRHWTGFFDQPRPRAGPPATDAAAAAAAPATVSVVIPSCDRPQLLQASIDSILAQTHQPLEVIVVDDASVDQAAVRDICAQRGVRLVALSRKHYKGGACNEAVRAARGDIVCFFDDDDLAHPDMLQTYVEAWRRMPDLDVISCFAACFEHERLAAGERDAPEYLSLALGGGLEVNLHINFFGKGTFAVRRSVFEAMGGYEVDHDSVPMVDYRFYIKAALHGATIRVIPQALYDYRKNSPNSLFYENKDKRHLQYLAKASIEKLVRSRCGTDMGAVLSTVVWNHSLPKFE